MRVIREGCLSLCLSLENLTISSEIRVVNKVGLCLWVLGVLWHHSHQIMLQLRVNDLELLTNLLDQI